MQRRNQAGRNAVTRANQELRATMGKLKDTISQLSVRVYHLSLNCASVLIASILYTKSKHMGPLMSQILRAKAQALRLKRRLTSSNCSFVQPQSKRMSALPS